jgi:hypothetical protein
MYPVWTAHLCGLPVLVDEVEDDHAGVRRSLPEFRQTRVLTVSTVTSMTTIPLSKAVLGHPDLTHSAKLLYAVLAGCAEADGTTVRVRKTWLSEQIGVTRRHVHRLLNDLEAAGVLEVHAGPRQPVYYRVLGG